MPLDWLHAAKVPAAVPAALPHLTIYAKLCYRIKQLTHFKGLHQQKIIFISLYIFMVDQLWPCVTVFIPGPRLMKENLPGILPVLRQWQGGEYSGNTQGLLTVLLRHGTHEFLLYVIGQSKSYVLV